MEFKTLKQYKAERQERAQNIAQQEKELQAAEKELEELKKNYEKEITKGIETGSEDEEAVTKISEEISDCEKKVHYLRTKLRVYRSVKPDIKVSADDVIEDFNLQFTPKFKEERVDPVIADLMAVKEEYIKKLEELHDAMEEHEEIRVDAYETTGKQTNYGSSHRYKYKPIKFPNDVLISKRGER